MKKKRETRAQQGKRMWWWRDVEVEVEVEVAFAAKKRLL
jgi:hypothetical protein